MKKIATKKIYATTMMAILIAVAFVPLLQAMDTDTNTNTLSKADWWNTSWTYRKLITIDPSMVAASLTNYPALIEIPSDADLAAQAQDDGDDIAFILFSDDTTQLDHELETFDGTTGETIAWVDIPSLSASQETKLWMYYGNPTTGNQQDMQGTWDNDYIAVHHLEETSGTIVDSTGYNNHGTAYGNLTMDTGGRINGADGFDGLTSHILLPQLYNNDTTFTIETWMNAQPGARYLLSQRSNSSQGLFIQILDDNFLQYYINGNSDITSITLNTWYHVVLTYDGATALLYLNGIPDNLTCSPPTWPDQGMYIGDRPAGDRTFNGTLDELRFSTIARSQDWVITSYNNQNDSAAFYSLGAQEQAPPSNQPPILSNQNPPDQSINVNINTASLSVVIEDPEGTPVSWTITTSPNIGSASGTDEANGTKTCSISGLGFSTTYSWTVKANDGDRWTNATYHFTTQPGAAITVNITKPAENMLYVQDQQRLSLPIDTIVYGPITITADVQSAASIENVEFYIDGVLKGNDSSAPYEFLWQPLIQFTSNLSLKHTITVVAHNSQGFSASDEINVTKWRFHPLPWILAGIAIASSLVLHTKITGWVYNLQESRFSCSFYVLSAFYKTTGPLRSARGVIKMKAVTGGKIIGPTSMTKLGPFHKLSLGSFTFLGVPHYTGGGLGQGLFKQLLTPRHSLLRS